ncbi:hypothetical protein [Aporhodopirellula aestuarii]|uniref:Uncharacterized protein n=1 Tax=Aporhodopirellula aestuarii TaxID=2950107 RepID=A0ABT0UA43_9BACT|nr:hypothetical protein [Aporhodopirellula aestuarii]MCM2373211.1 hypothetical protein [Aporhodopirellula aestuarii]
MRILSILDTDPRHLPPSPWEQPHAWMLRRLRVTLGIAVILFAVQTVSAVSRTGWSVRTTSEETKPSMTEQPRAVLPQGWRRTASGWQHVSTWSAIPDQTLSLTEHVIAQRDAEPPWLREGMAMLRQIHPGWIAIAQLTAVGVLFLASRHQSDQTCPTRRRYFFREPNGARPVTKSHC